MGLLVRADAARLVALRLYGREHTASGAPLAGWKREILREHVQCGRGITLQHAAFAPTGEQLGRHGIPRVRRTPVRRSGNMTCTILCSSSAARCARSAASMTSYGGA